MIGYLIWMRKIIKRDALRNYQTKIYNETGAIGGSGSPFPPVKYSGNNL